MTDSINSEEDFKLLAKMKRGDIKAYNVLFRKYYPLLCTYCYRFVDKEDVEDIVQDVMTWLWENRETDCINTSLNSYLYRMVYNQALNRKHHNEIKFRVEHFFQERMVKEHHNQDPVYMKELMMRTQKAIESLPPQYREAFVMHRFNEKSYKEIAEQLQVSPKTVDYRIQQALKLLRVWLKDYLPLLMPLLN
ncbi:RNA polymerase sigma-70 factor [uncultured Bacteroides sp.]|uniref:RNA polymerase sigma-70 factor n=1 Tax=uncultured Bacteroides sp. TaxID=162156 RepID=UPI0025D70B08|nr:RNA polymerase sigma-70 factor [uncultured Bacteroides sp.]